MDNNVEAAPLTGEIIIDEKQKELVRVTPQNQLTASPQFQSVLKDMAEITKYSQKIIQQPLSELTEEQFSAEKKALKPLRKYHRELTKDIPKIIRKHYKELQDHDLNQLYDALKAAGFDQFDELDQQVKQRERDMRANRKAERWASLKANFDGNLELYPELTQLAPDTLGSFEYYQNIHDDLVSGYKTKPITEDTIAQLNADLKSYHENLQRLTQSGLNSDYQQQVIKQYAVEPTTDNMLALIKDALVQQAKATQLALQAKVQPLATEILNEVLINNQVVQNTLVHAADSSIDKDKLTAFIKQLLQQTATSLLQSIVSTSFITNGMIDQDKLRTSLESACEQNMPNLVQAVKNLSQIKPVSKKKHTDPWQWLKDYLNTQYQGQNYHEPQVKVVLINDLYQHMLDQNSIWRQHAKSYQDILTINAYLLNL